MPVNLPEKRANASSLEGLGFILFILAFYLLCGAAKLVDQPSSTAEAASITAP